MKCANRKMFLNYLALHKCMLKNLNKMHLVWDQNYYFLIILCTSRPWSDTTHRLEGPQIGYSSGFGQHQVFSETKTKFKIIYFWNYLLTLFTCTKKLISEVAVNGKHSSGMLDGVDNEKDMLTQKLLNLVNPLPQSASKWFFFHIIINNQECND